MRLMKTAAIGLFVVALLAGVGLAGPWGTGGGDGIKAKMLAYYWSLLRDDQREVVKEAVADHLAATAPDRLRVAARLMELRADVVEVLSPDQRKKAAHLKQVMSRLPRDRRIGVIDRVLDGTDRGLLADRIERAADAGASGKLDLGLSILDQVLEALLLECRTRLDLTADQESRIAAAYERAKTDLRPALLRLSEAKEHLTRTGLGILDDDQRAKLDAAKEKVLSKVTAFIRG